MFGCGVCLFSEFFFQALFIFVLKGAPSRVTTQDLFHLFDSDQNWTVARLNDFPKKRVGGIR